MTKQEFRKQLKEVGVEYNKYRISCYEKQHEPVEFHKYIFTEMLCMPIGEEKCPIVGMKCNCGLHQEEEEVEQWSADKLEDGDEYWSITNFGDVADSNWDGGRIDLFRLKNNNIYQTKELAQEAYNKIMSKN